MKVIIAGSRDIVNYNMVKDIIDNSDFVITEVVSGMARGVDSIGIRYAKENNLPLTCFPASWDKYGKASGPIRNQEMAEYADALICIYMSDSKGSKDMIKKAIDNNLHIYAIHIDTNLLEWCNITKE